MKKTYFLLSALLLCFVFTACKKKSSDNNQPTTYRVDGISDITINPTSSYYYNSSLQLDVNYIGPVQEHVALSVAGLPPGLTIDTTQSLSGVPTFSCVINFINNGAAPGNYPVKLICNGSSTGQKYYNFNIKVLPCFYNLLGVYTNCTAYGATYVYYQDTANYVSGTADEINLSNFAGTHRSVMAKVSCGSNIIAIPTQTVGGVTISGSGTQAGTTMQFNYEIDSAGITTYGNVYMNK